MVFFDAVKKKLRIRNIFWAVFSGLTGCALSMAAPLIGFSNDTKQALSLSVFNIEIPMPNWFFFCVNIFVVIILACLCVSKIRDAIKNPQYHGMIADAEKIGDVYDIDYELRLINPSPLVKGGELRYSPKVLFYMKDTDVFIIDPVKIQSIQTKATQGKHSMEYYVLINAGNGQEVKIRAKKKTVEKLADDLIYTLKHLKYFPHNNK